MVKLTKIYTRGGDKGETSLATGERRKKHDLRIETYGKIDEANAAIGLARLHTAGTTADDMLARIQNDLFDAGADLATPDAPDLKWKPIRLSDQQVARLEGEIDQLNADLEPLNSFILPGGSPASAYLHLSRTLVRAAERLAWALADREAVNPAAVKYLNRLSDHLFVLSRVLNDGGRADILWKPGQNS